MGIRQRQGQRRGFAPLAAALLLTAWAGNASAQLGIALPEGVGDLYMLDVHASGNVLGESLLAYTRNDIFFVDFGSFVASLEFPVARSGDTWSGWFFSEDRPFSWQMTTGITSVAGQRPGRIDAENWFQYAGEVFVALPVLEQWFGVELMADLRQQTLTVRSEEPLPFEAWQDRTLAKYYHRASTRLEPDFVIADQYNWATQPLVSLDSQLATRRNGDVRTTSSTTSIAASMDLLKHSVSFSGAFTNNSGAAARRSETTRRMTVERFARRPSEPIFADIHHYAFGDIFETSPNLVTIPNTGRGFRFDRYSDSHAGNLSTATITDTAPPGWEVELYRNGTLIDFATVGPDGRYIFPDQDVYFGENEFVARIYGPQGQVREDRQTLFGGGIELDPGDYDYSVSHVDYSENLLDGQVDNYATLPASYATDLRYSRALSADVEIGGAFTQAGVGTRSRDGNFTDREYLSLFGRARLGQGVLVGEAVRQLDTGQAISLEYLTELGGKTFSFSHRIYSDFDSPATLQSEPLDTMSEISALGSFGPDDRNGYRAGIRRRVLRSGVTDYRLFSRIGTRLGPVSLTNELEYRVDSAEDSTLGHLRLAGRVGRMSIRGQVDYSLSGRQPIRQVSASMNFDFTRRLSDSFTISRVYDAGGRTYASNLVSVRVRNYDLTFQAASDFEQDWSLAAGISFAFGYDARRRSFLTDHQPLAHTGRATVNLFVDRNMNGVRDAGEPPVEGAIYRDNRAPDTTPGTVTLTALPAETAIRIDTRQFRFSDPFLAPRLNAYELQTHAGSYVEIDIPVVMTGDIEGTVLGKHDMPVRGVELTLLAADGTAIADARSEFDGYYSFTGVPGGDYAIAQRSADGELEVLTRVTLDAERGFVTVEDIVLAASPATGTSP